MKQVIEVTLSSAKGPFEKPDFSLACMVDPDSPRLVDLRNLLLAIMADSAHVSS